MLLHTSIQQGYQTDLCLHTAICELVEAHELPLNEQSQLVWSYFLIEVLNIITKKFSDQR